MAYEAEPHMVASLLLKAASFIDSPDGYGSSVTQETSIVPSGSPVDGKPTAFVEKEPDLIADPLTERFLKNPEVDPAPKNEEGEIASQTAVNSPESSPDKEFMQTPWVKPPRREAFNDSSTRGYRNEYQENYRDEHGNRG